MTHLFHGRQINAAEINLDYKSITRTCDKFFAITYFRSMGSCLQFFAGKPMRTQRRRRESFVITTGTGPGKSFCIFIPIIDIYEKYF